LVHCPDPVARRSHGDDRTCAVLGDPRAASSALAPDEINSNTNNLSSRVMRANFDRPSDTTTPSDRATTT
jgi:hypothetical protein